jgi:hypothetical protein
LEEQTRSQRNTSRDAVTSFRARSKI